MTRRWGEGPMGLIERVRRRRVIVAVAAWAYELNMKPTMSDAEYDELSKQVHQERNFATGNHRLDRFFQRHFDASTGLWIHQHPELDKVEQRYMRVHYPELYKQEIKRQRQRERRAARRLR